MLRYDRERAVQYAKKYALDYNPAYFRFDGIGGDCTNYISQCLLAGGGKMNYDKYYGWFYVNQNNRSPSWTDVDYLQKFLLSGRAPGFVVAVLPIEDLQIGDIIQIRQNPYSFNHSVIITKITPYEIYVCAHSNDVLDKPLSEYDYLELKGIHIVGINA